MKAKISIVIPTYNEKGNILRLLSILKTQAKKQEKYLFEAVVVDDNSPDGTAAEIKKQFRPPFVTLIVRKKKKGLGTAIKEGILASSGEIIVGMDADLNHDPKVLPKIVSGLSYSDLVIGSRFIKGGGMEDKKRYYLTFVFNLILKHLFGFDSTDNLSGYYAIKRIKLKKLGLNKIYYGYGDYHLRLVFYAKKKGYKLSEVPVFYQKRRYGESKSNLLKLVFTYLKEAVRLVCFNEKQYSSKERSS